MLETEPRSAAETDPDNASKHRHGLSGAGDRRNNTTVNKSFRTSLGGMIKDNICPRRIIGLAVMDGQTHRLKAYAWTR